MQLLTTDKAGVTKMETVADKQIIIPADAVNKLVQFLGDYIGDYGSNAMEATTKH